jgi:truncated hemoglobin YjbI
VPDPSQIAKRVAWAHAALAQTADELAELDPEASAAFAQEAERVAELRTFRVREREPPPRTRSAALGRGNHYLG